MSRNVLIVIIFAAVFVAGIGAKSIFDTPAVVIPDHTGQPAVVVIPAATQQDVAAAQEACSEKLEAFYQGEWKTGWTKVGLPRPEIALEKTEGLCTEAMYWQWTRDRQ